MERNNIVLRIPYKYYSMINCTFVCQRSLTYLKTIIGPTFVTFYCNERQVLTLNNIL